MKSSEFARVCQGKLAQIAQEGNSVCLSPEEADFLEVELWDDASITEEGGEA